MPPETLNPWLPDLLALARHRNHRALVCLSGDRAWGEAQAREALACLGEGGLWVGTGCDGTVPAITGSQGTRWLGQEREWLVWNAWDGLHPSGFGALLGTLRGGGVLLLVVPPFADWPGYPDPDYQRLRDHRPPYRFLARWRDALLALDRRPDSLLHWVTPEDGAPPLVSLPDTPPIARPSGPTEDQKRVVEGVWRVMTGRRRTPLIVRADRGRGKSAALGMAAGQLIGALSPAPRIGVTAPGKAAVDSLWAFAGEAGQASAGHLTFWPPDRLLEAQPDLDLLLIDEAAGLPVPVLNQLVDRYSRVVLATTVHGYEGSGRGFDLRFRQQLQARVPRTRTLTLDQPVRWAANDPLEAWVNGVLALDVDLPDPAERSVPGHTPSALTLSEWSAAQLATDPDTLNQVFALLVHAHYQTAPEDLRQLLDDPASRLWVARVGGTCVGVLWLLEEGGLSPDLAREVWLGNRRPRGHLLAQSLAFHGGEPRAAQARWGRITRIAVHPGWQHQGIGRRLVEEAAVALAGDGVEALGVSFGATADLMAFWARCDLTLLRLGMNKDAASGTYGAMLGRGLNDTGQTLCQHLKDSFSRHWETLALTHWQDLDADVALAVIQGLTLDTRAWARQDDQELVAFTRGHRPFLLTRHTLQRLHRRIAALAGASVISEWSAKDRQLWVAMVWQGYDWHQARARQWATGQKDAEARLRELATLLAARLA